MLWHGGQVQSIRPSVLHLMRGQLYDIGGGRFFTMGGASSHDIRDGILEPDDPRFREKRRRLTKQGRLFRVNHRSWWAEELPSEAEYAAAQATLDRAGWEVDYIISYCCPSGIQDELSGGMYQPDTLADFFEEVRQRCGFQCWFLGRYHDNAVIEKRFVLLYDQILKLK